MPIRFLAEHSEERPVSLDLLVQTIERNRDRLRTTGTMFLTLSGLLLSTCLAVTLYLLEKQRGGKIALLVTGLASLCLLASACLSISATFLRSRYAITSEAQFATDLLRLFNAELRLARLAFSSLLAGLCVLTLGIVILAYMNGGQ